MTMELAGSQKIPADIIIIIIINEKINVAFSPKTTRTRNIPKKNEKTTCSVDREKQAVEQRSEPSVRHCEQVRL